MNTKAIAIAAAVLAALLGVLAVAHVDDVDAADDSQSPIYLGKVQVGVGYEKSKEGAQFSAKISEQTYVNETSYQVVWTISYGADDSKKTWTFTYTKGGDATLTATNPDNTADTDIPKIVMKRGDVGYYIITMSDFPKVQSADVTYDFTITSQISLKIVSENDLVLNTNQFSATVITYNNCLASLEKVELKSETNYPEVGVVFEGSTGKTIGTGNYEDYVWYATRLPAGLTIKDGIISGMPVQPTDDDGESVILAVRGTTGTDNGREYYGTLTVIVGAYSNLEYTITIKSTEPNKLVGSGQNYVAVNGASLTLTINSKDFDGQATMINTQSGVRTPIELTSNTGENTTTGAIADAGVGTYIVKVVWNDDSRDITLRVVAQTAGTSGAGFVVIGK